VHKYDDVFQLEQVIIIIIYLCLLGINQTAEDAMGGHVDGMKNVYEVLVGNPERSCEV
jgi:hypothetical protein